MSAWSEHFLAMAQLCAEKSQDPSTKVGAVIVGPDHEVRSTGYNDFPRGVADRIDERRERPAKYLYTEHAERNAIYNAARVGIPVKGCALYLNWEPKLCADCARAVIQSGIVRVIGGDRPFPGHKPTWEESCRVGYEMLVEAGVDVDLVGCGPRSPMEKEVTFVLSGYGGHNKLEGRRVTFRACGLWSEERFRDGKVPFGDGFVLEDTWFHVDGAEVREGKGPDPELNFVILDFDFLGQGAISVCSEVEQ